MCVCVLTGGQHSREKEKLRELNTEETVLSPLYSLGILVVHLTISLRVYFSSLFSATLHLNLHNSGCLVIKA